MSQPSTLHLLLSVSENAWRDCLLASKASDTVVLLDEGVLGLVRNDRHCRPESCRMLVSAADLQARMGTLPADAEEVALVSDADLVSLLESHAHCVSWR